MPDKWVTLAEAAAGMKVHPRTVERQIKSGKLQSRRTDGGQLEVLVDLPDPPTAEESALSVVAGQAENQVQLALGATSAIVKTAQEDARLARIDADRAWEETRIARRNGVIAWISVGGMAAALMAAIGWTASTMTRTQVELSHASDQVRQVTDTAGQLAAERDRLRAQLTEANEKRAEAVGELTGRVAADNATLTIALRQQEQRAALNAPTTAPTAHADTPPDTIKSVAAQAPTTLPSATLAHASGSTAPHASVPTTQPLTFTPVKKATPAGQKTDMIANTSPGIPPGVGNDE